jgi:hypothetical protein
MQQLKDELTKPRDGSKRADKDQNDTSRNFRDNADGISRDSGGRGPLTRAQATAALSMMAGSGCLTRPEC